LLSQGGFAKIYRAHDTRTRREVVLKVPATRYPGEAHVDEFLREARANGKLRHPLIVRILDVFVEGRAPVLVQPLGRESLADRLARAPGGRPPLTDVLRYAHDMLVALAFAHRRHLLHCDVKPDNLIILRSGRLALSDFGAARRGRRTVHADGTGTAEYMAPEQAAGRPSARSDVYSAGLVLREMLAGSDGRDISERRRLPAGLGELVERATATDPNRRYPDAVAMLEAFRRIERRHRRRRQ
jgi:eukaryotic-like serine/threonine-protein kinase